jgi:hypothetical protein
MNEEKSEQYLEIDGEKQEEKKYEISFLSKEIIKTGGLNW